MFSCNTCKKSFGLLNDYNLHIKDCSINITEDKQILIVEENIGESLENKKNSTKKSNKKYGICVELNCDKRAYFNYTGKKRGLYCAKHKKENMIDIKNKKCIEPNCTKNPIFNNPGETIGLYCAKHKKENMVDVKSKKCIEPNCTKQPYFNFPGEKIGIYCATHKKENMINVKDKKCIELNCMKIPYFNFPGEKIGIYCAKHKKENMVKVKNKSGEKKRLYSDINEDNIETKKRKE